MDEQKKKKEILKTQVIGQFMAFLCFVRWRHFEQVVSVSVFVFFSGDSLVHKKFSSV